MFDKALAQKLYKGLREFDETGEFDLDQSREIKDIYIFARDHGMASHAAAIVSSLEDNADYGSDLEDSIQEIADSTVDIYYADLAKWVGNTDNFEYCDTALEEFGAPEGIVNLLQLGQLLACQELASMLLAVLENGEEDDEDDLEGEDD